MRFDADQADQFRQQGWVLRAGLLAPDEVGALRAEVPSILAQERPENLREKSGRAVRSALSCHLYNEAFRRLVRHPRLHLRDHLRIRNLPHSVRHSVLVFYIDRSAICI